MKRPSFQFFPADWRNNAKLRTCSLAERGAWLEVLCLMHDSDEYGVLRWPLSKVARAAGVPLLLLRALAASDVLKGADAAVEPFVHRTFHAGEYGEPVTLVVDDGGPCWYCSRMVVDEYVRNRRGAGSRFTSANQPSRSPTRPIGERQGDGRGDGRGDAKGERQGDGPSSASSSSSSPTDTDVPTAAVLPTTPEDPSHTPRARARSTVDYSHIADQLSTLSVRGNAGRVLQTKDVVEALQDGVTGDDLMAVVCDFPDQHSIVWLTKKAIARKELWDKARRAGCSDELIAATIAFKGGKVELGIASAIGQLQDWERGAALTATTTTPVGANGQRAPESCRAEAPSLAKKAGQ